LGAVSTPGMFARVVTILFATNLRRFCGLQRGLDSV
jgi:hypothetical protein